MYWPCGVPQVFAQHGSSIVVGRTGTDDTGISNAANATNNSELNILNGAHKQNDDSETKSSSLGPSSETIIDIQISRSDQFILTLSKRTVQLWSARPTALLASLTRSETSLNTYGESVKVLFRPDASVIVLHTSFGYLITYGLETEPNARVLQVRTDHSQSRKQSIFRTFGSSDAIGLGEILFHFRRAIKIDAGISSVLPLEQEIIVATVKPTAVQCIKWDSLKGSPQASTQLVSKTDWIEAKTIITSMIHDRAMNLSIWIGEDGTAYAVRRARPQAATKTSSDESERSTSASSTPPPHRLFDGYCFHRSNHVDGKAKVTAVNARFSLIAIATSNGKVLCYAAKDYAGNIPLSHTFGVPSSAASAGAIHSLGWSPDGYCLFIGYQKGWIMWSVFGKEGASSFTSNGSHAVANKEEWLLGVRSANWTSNGAEIILSSPTDDRIWKLEMSRSAAVGCFSCANLVRALQQTPTELAIYRGHDLPDLTSISNEASLWHHAQYPLAYLHNQWPIRASVVSQDGRYIAIAGRRGLAHYSVSSGRWKAFFDNSVENSFAVRGGMCWFNHILAVATEHAGGYDLRLYSRDQDLGRFPLHLEAFSKPIAFLGPSGEDSLLLYTHENILYHFIINLTPQGAQLMQVGQIAFHGVIRAPSRVRSVSWILPDHQLRNGDPSRDVEHATVLFLVDDKLVLLQPSRTPEDAVKYDMRVIAHHVEYYILMRDQIYFNFNEPLGEPLSPIPSPGSMMSNMRGHTHYTLRDSLWTFTGTNLCMWSNVRELLSPIAGDILAKSALLSVPVDFYPLSILLNKGVVLGIESELLQRRDLSFAMFKSLIRTQLFLPYVLKHQLLDSGDTSAAFAQANQYQNLTYFPHALEILLHIVLDNEGDRRSSKAINTSQTEPLPAVLSFLQIALSPTTYLSTIVQCVRKTEFSFWRYLFAHLPSPEAMFEEALRYNDLKTASGYLIVMQTLEEQEEQEDENADEEEETASGRRFEEQVIRLMSLAREQNDFELCAELARFLIGIDPRGHALRRVVDQVGFRRDSAHIVPRHHTLNQGLGLQIPDQQRRVEIKPDGKLDTRLTRLLAEEPRSAGAESEGMMSRSSGGDYFSASPGMD